MKASSEKLVWLRPTDMFLFKILQTCILVGRCLEFIWPMLASKRSDLEMTL